MYQFRYEIAWGGKHCEVCGEPIAEGDRYWRFRGGSANEKVAGHRLPRMFCGVCHFIYGLPGEEWTGEDWAPFFVWAMTTKENIVQSQVMLAPSKRNSESEPPQHKREPDPLTKLLTDVFTVTP